VHAWCSDRRRATRLEVIMLRGYAAVFHAFRQEDFVGFAERHDRLYAEARRTGDHGAVIRAFYALMARVIARSYGESWHFCPPEHAGQSREDATHALHRRLAREARLTRGAAGLDVGCGVGGAMLDLATSHGIDLTGITMGANEVEACNAAARALGVSGRCRAVQGDAQALPFADESFDGGYALYSFKYLARLDRVLAEVARVLRPGGRFVVYDIVKTEAYDERDPTHASLVHEFEYACGMPDLHTMHEMAEVARRHGLVEVARTDLSGRHTWYHYFATTPLLPWLVRSRAVSRLVHALERVGVLPRGFARFNDRFVSGIVRALLEGGRRGIISGSALLVLERPARPESPPSP
jgi:ubiquinone/menaquinone biosynthesis C-methylase UbiE